MVKNGQLGAVAQLQLFQNLTDAIADSAFAEMKLGSYFSIIEAICH